MVADAAHEIAAVLVCAETKVIGRPRRTPPRGAHPSWWTEDVADAAARHEEWVALLHAATAAGGPVELDDGEEISLARASREAAQWRRLFAERRLAAVATWLQQRLQRARRERDDPRAVRAAHAKICESVETVSKCSGGGELHTWRAMDSGGGKLVFGDDAAAALASNIKSWHEDDPDDVRFSRREAAARAVEFRRLRCDVLPRECARGTAQRQRVETDAAARGDVADWRQWELEVQRGRRVPSDDELLAYFATPVRVDEVRVVARAAARRKAPSPGDWVTADVIAHGGRAVWRVLALLFSIMLATGITPPEWRVGFRRDLYKKGSRLDWLSFRGIVLGSNVAKCFERVLLRRLRITTTTDVWQAVGGVGVDCRH